ncbi:MAG: DUF2892 domain-containing protein [Candidatus Gracilibacteria bacterium]|nr:DUF2892 domain-containing protein [Candidatus Gracilibacteria bacterium]
MNTGKNLSLIDRLLRIILAEIFLIIGFFWFGGILQIILYVFTLIFILTGIIGFCPLYKPFGLNTYENEKKLGKIYQIGFVIFFFILAIFGSYYSNFFTKKIFIEDYNKMNNYYKQTLFNTGKDKREESIKNYDLLIFEYKIFSDKYMTYHPYILKNDAKLNTDLVNIGIIINTLKEQVYTGDLPKVHLEFEKIRPIFQDILKRNNFSMLAISLVDFHDVMEKIIENADKKDTSGILSTYIVANEKLKIVENESNDDEIKSIRKSLEDIKSLASAGRIDELGKKAQELKANFVKVYLKKG